MLVFICKLIATFFLPMNPSVIITGSVSNFQEPCYLATYKAKDVQNFISDGLSEKDMKIQLDSNKLYVAYAYGQCANTKKPVLLMSLKMDDRLYIFVERPKYQTIGDFTYSKPFFIAAFDADVNSIVLVERIRGRENNAIVYGFTTLQTINSISGKRLP